MSNVINHKIKLKINLFSVTIYNKHVLFLPHVTICTNKKMSNFSLSKKISNTYNIYNYWSLIYFQCTLYPKLHIKDSWG